MLRTEINNSFYAINVFATYSHAEASLVELVNETKSSMNYFQSKVNIAVNALQTLHLFR